MTKIYLLYPTMGGLHKGHIFLIKKSKNFKGKTLVTIYRQSKTI